MHACYLLSLPIIKPTCVIEPNIQQLYHNSNYGISLYLYDFAGIFNMGTFVRVYNLKFFNALKPKPISGFLHNY